MRRTSVSRQHIQLNQAIGRLSTADAVLTYVGRQLPRLNVVNCVTSLQRLAKLGWGAQEGRKALQPLLDRTLEEVQNSNRVEPRHVAGVLWSVHARPPLAPLHLYLLDERLCSVPTPEPSSYLSISSHPLVLPVIYSVHTTACPTFFSFSCNQSLLGGVWCWDGCG